MEKRKICTICDKSYSNGKALGGHMRSHFAMLPLPPKSPPPNPAPVSSPPSSLNNTTHPKNDRPSKPQADDPAESKFVATTRRRSERRRRTTAPVVLAAAERRRRSSSSSAAADAAVALSDEEAARFLIELSRDKWAPETEIAPEEEEEGEEVAVITIRSSPQRFRCETCNKEFGSHQALGGHKANHKRMKSHCKKALSGLDQDEDEEEDEDKDEDEDEDEDGGENGDGDGVEEELAVAAEEEEEEEKARAFQCEFCFKVFGSGQALGGHKKAHFSTHLPRNALSPKFGGTLVIDLNFPPPPPNGDDDDDDQEVQVQVISHKGFSTLISN